MNRVAELLRHLRSCTVMQVHDELLLEIHGIELDIIPQIVKIMEDAYTPKYLPMACSVAFSWKSWGDLEEGLPY